MGYCWEKFINCASLPDGVVIYITDLDKYFKSVNGQWVEISKLDAEKEMRKKWLDELPEFLKPQAD